MKNSFGQFLVYGAVVAGLLVLVRNGSNGAGFVTALGGMLTKFVQAITGQKTTG